MTTGHPETVVVGIAAIGRTEPNLQQGPSGQSHVAAAVTAITLVMSAGLQIKHATTAAR
jgi:hypothetical protein